MAVYPSKDIEREAAKLAADAACACDAAPGGQAACASCTTGSACSADASRSGDSAASACSAAPEVPGAPGRPVRARSRRRTEPPRALISAVEPGSPADDAGFAPGCYLTSVDGKPLRDLIDWRWLSADDVITVGYIDLDGEAGEVELERDLGEDWGFEFEGVVFDGVRQCRNACIFCFMRQLPDDMRPSLTLRDDDFRLSFLAGTFVTFTNLSAADEQRIIDQRISPLRVSLHASNPEVRRRIIGRHAQHGIDVLDRLLAQGIEFHAQIVLMPDENDGDVLRETLEWAFARPGILDVCIVPLGFTKHQTCFTKSFNDPAAARRAMDEIVPIQRRALAERGTLWAFAADEFYSNAYGDELLENLPSASQYGDFGMFEDGVGIIRMFVDDWEAARAAGADTRAVAALEEAGVFAVMLSGMATRHFFGRLVAESPAAASLEVMHVKNEFFGGNVDVTGLLCGCDMASAIRRRQAALGVAGADAPDAASPDGTSPDAGSAVSGPASDARRVPAAPGTLLFCIPKIVFNDDGVTLDDMTLEDIRKATGARVAVVSCNASEFLPEIAQLAWDLPARAAASGIA